MIRDVTDQSTGNEQDYIDVLSIAEAVGTREKTAHSLDCRAFWSLEERQNKNTLILYLKRPQAHILSDLGILELWRQTEGSPRDELPGPFRKVECKRKVMSRRTRDAVRQTYVDVASGVHVADEDRENCVRKRKWLSDIEKKSYIQTASTWRFY